MNQLRKLISVEYFYLIFLFCYKSDLIVQHAVKDFCCFNFFFFIYVSVFVSVFVLYFDYSKGRSLILYIKLSKSYVNISMIFSFVDTDTHKLTERSLQFAALYTKIFLFFSFYILLVYFFFSFIFLFIICFFFL